MRSHHRREAELTVRQRGRGSLERDPKSVSLVAFTSERKIHTCTRVHICCNRPEIGRFSIQFRRVN